MLVIPVLICNETNFIRFSLIDVAAFENLNTGEESGEIKWSQSAELLK